MINSIVEMYSFGFMRNALAIGVFGGGLLAFLGIFVHLRRIVFLGAALPQLVALGIATALLVSLSPFLGAFIGGVLGILILSVPSKNDTLPPEGWIGLAFAAGSSLAVVLVALSPSPDGAVLRFFTGDILGTSFTDAALAFGAAVLTAILFRLFWSRIVIVGFDPIMSTTLGIKVYLWNAVLFLCLGLGLAVVMNTAGGMLAFSMLIGPAAAALMLFRSFPAIIITSIGFGVLASFVGLTASFLYDLPGGPAMATAALLPVFLVWPVKFLQRRLKIRR